MFINTRVLPGLMEQFTEEELLRRINLDAGVVCVPGTWFGRGGENHLRLNVGCTRATLEHALPRIECALKK